MVESGRGIDMLDIIIRFMVAIVGIGILSYLVGRRQR